MGTKTVPPPTQTFLLGRDPERLAGFAALHPTLLSSHGQWCQHVAHGGRHVLWISEDAPWTGELLQWIAASPRVLGDALLFYTPAVETVPVLQAYFRHTVFGCAEHFLPAEELADVLLDDRKADLVIGGLVDHVSQHLSLWRGSLEFLPVPFTAFAPSGNGVSPDFEQFRVTDYGQTIQLGPYEATTESLLYEFDPDYRRRIGKERRASEQSFGAALRRLRKQRGLRREDFAPLSAKTLARIEQGAVLPDALRERTWRILAEKLGVTPEDIATF